MPRCLEAARVLGHRSRAAPILEAVAHMVCGLVRTETVFSSSDRYATEIWSRHSSDYSPVTARRASKENNEMRPLRYSINVTLDGCCHHEAGLPPDEESMRYWTAAMERADALLFGRVTYEMMESAWREPATGTWPDWMGEWEIPFAETIDRARKYVVSSTLSVVDWNAELVRGDLGPAVERLKQEPGEALFVGGVTLPLALADLGLIDEYEFLVQPVLAGYGPTLLAGLHERIELELVDRHEFRSGAVVLRYRPTQVAA
jgi:dihydrofolate reductase